MNTFLCVFVAVIAMAAANPPSYGAGPVIAGHVVRQGLGIAPSRVGGYGNVLVGPLQNAGIVIRPNPPATVWHAGAIPPPTQGRPVLVPSVSTRSGLGRIAPLDSPINELAALTRLTLGTAGPQGVIVEPYPRVNTRLPIGVVAPGLGGGALVRVGGINAGHGVASAY